MPVPSWAGLWRQVGRWVQEEAAAEEEQGAGGETGADDRDAGEAGQEGREDGEPILRKLQLRRGVYSPDDKEPTEGKGAK